MERFRDEISAQDWYFISLIILIGIFSVFVYYAVIPIDLGLGALVILFIMLFFSLEEIMPNARKVRKRKLEARKRYLHKN